MPITGGQLSSIPTYDGSTDVQLFIASVTSLATGFGWDDPETAQAAKSRLLGAGQQWLEALRKKNIAYDIFVDTVNNAGVVQAIGLRTALIRRFGERISELAAADAVTKLEQGENENVDCFHDRVVIALDRKNFSYTDAEKAAPAYRVHFDVDTYTFFAAGLREAIRTRTMGSVTPPRTIEALLTAARSVELEINRAKRLGVDSIQKGNTCLKEMEAAEAAAAAGKGAPPTMEQQVASLQKEIAEMRIGKNKLVTNKSNITCFRCQKKGHYARECRGGNSGGQRGNGRGRYVRGGRGGGGYRGFTRGGGQWQQGSWGQRQQGSWAVEEDREEPVWYPSEN